MISTNEPIASTSSISTNSVISPMNRELMHVMMHQFAGRNNELVEAGVAFVNDYMMLMEGDGSGVSCVHPTFPSPVHPMKGL